MRPEQESEEPRDESAQDESSLENRSLQNRGEQQPAPEPVEAWDTRSGEKCLISEDAYLKPTVKRLDWSEGDDEMRFDKVVESSPDSPAAGSKYLFTRMVCFLLFLLALTYFAPMIAEEVSYRIARGRQRGQYEIASKEIRTTALRELSDAYQMVSQRVSPSVVHINTGTTPRPPIPRKRGQFDFRDMLPNPHPSQGQGSGVIVDVEGYILTNRHVILDSKDIVVKLADGRRTKARIVGVDELTDLAVLKIEAKGLIAVEFGNSDNLEVGALVWALGSPFGLERSITFGILSQKHRTTKVGRHHQDFLQTDAAVNPGNSGGPLVDANGRLVGINTAIVGETYQGISFAVPSVVAKVVYKRIKKHGRMMRGWLGVQLSDIDATKANVETGGAMVMAFAPGYESPARRAGIQVGDIIVRWNKTPIPSMSRLIRAVGDTEVGTYATMEVIRDGERLTIEVAVAERPNEVL